MRAKLEFVRQLIRHSQLEFGNPKIGLSFRLLTILLGLLQTGCTTAGMLVELTPLHSSKPLNVTFTRAYYTPSESGEDQIVLVSDPIDQPPETSPGDPLPAIASPPIWQVLLIDLHWRTPPAGNLDSPVASNAALHWYVFGNLTGTRSGVLHYSGQGSVWFNAGKSQADVTVKSDEMTLIDQHDPLHDPFTSFHISTRFHAIANSNQLQQIMDQVHRAIAEGDQKAKSETTRPAE